MSSVSYSNYCYIFLLLYEFPVWVSVLTFVSYSWHPIHQTASRIDFCSKIWHACINVLGAICTFCVNMSEPVLIIKCDNYWHTHIHLTHYNDVIMSTMASQITSLPSVFSGAGQRKHQSSASLAFVRRFYRWPMNSPHKEPVTRKMFPLDDVIMFINYVRWWCFKIKATFPSGSSQNMYPN